MLAQGLAVEKMWVLEQQTPQCLQRSCPNLFRLLRLANMEHLAEPRGFVQLVLLFGLFLSVCFGIGWISDVVQLYCLQPLPWNKENKSLRYASCVWELFGGILFWRNASDMAFVLAFYDDAGQHVLQKKRKILHHLMKQCKETLDEVRLVMENMQHKRVDDVQSIIDQHFVDQTEVLVDLRNKFRDPNRAGCWQSNEAEEVFQLLVLQMAEYLDEPNKLAISFWNLAPRDWRVVNENSQSWSTVAEQEAERVETIVQHLLSAKDLEDQEQRVIGAIQYNQFMGRRFSEWMQLLLARILGCLCCGPASLCWCIHIPMRSGRDTGMVHVDDADGYFAATGGELPEEQMSTGEFVLRPIRKALDMFNNIEIADRDTKDDDNQAECNAMNGLYGIGECPEFDDKHTEGYPRTVRCGCLWFRLLSRVHVRLLLGVVATFIFLLIYAWIARKLVNDIFIRGDSVCRKNIQEMWPCEVALVRKCLGVLALFTYLAIVAFVLRRFDRFDTVLQVELDIMELQDFKMDIEALESELQGVAEDAGFVLDEVMHRLQRRSRIIQTFKQQTRHEKELYHFRALTKSLANARDEAEHRRSVDLSEAATGLRMQRRRSSFGIRQMGVDGDPLE